MVPQLFPMTLCLHQTPDLWSVIDVYLMVGIGGYGRVNPGVQGPLRITEPLVFHVSCFCSVVHGSPWHRATAHTLMCIPHTLWYLLFNSHHKLTEWRYHWLTQMMISKWGTCHSSGLWSAWEIKMGDRSPFLQFIFVFAGAELGLCLWLIFRFCISPFFPLTEIT